MPDNEEPKKRGQAYNLTSNSNKKKDKPAADEVEKKVVEKITTGKVVEKKKSLGKRIQETFSLDDSRSVLQYIVQEVVIPGTKNLIWELFTQGLDRTLFGGRGVGGGGGRHGSGRRNYSSISKRDREDGPSGRYLSSSARSTHNFSEITLETRPEADEVLERLDDLIKDYDVATVDDLYNLVGITGSYQDNKWGWTDLRHADIRRVRDGYLLELPRAVPID